MLRYSARLSEKLLTPSSRRMVVTWAIDEKGYSQRRACVLIGMEPKTYRYASTQRGQRAARTAIRADRDGVVEEQVGEVDAGELAALVGVEDFRRLSGISCGAGHDGSKRSPPM